MRKIIWPLIVTGLAFNPVMTLTSCNQGPIIDRVYNEALNQFVGKNWKGGICSIPHPSGQLDEIRNYLKGVLAKFGVTPMQDKYGNLWYDIPASYGCKNWKKLVLQGHMDMVWTRVLGEERIKNPIPVLDEDENGEPIIHTAGYKSSLGADDGTGISTILAITALQNAFQHGDIRCIFTADEEPGLVGAANIGWINDEERINPVSHDDGWDYLINIDGEQEEEISVSCSGGYSRKYVKENFSNQSIINIDNSYTGYKLLVSGGQGGHSGIAIKDNLCNTIKIGAEVLLHINNEILSSDPPLNLVSINCWETANNVVPKSLEINFASKSTEISELSFEYINQLEEKIHTDHPNESKLNISLRTISLETSAPALTGNVSNGILNWIDKTYYGLYAKDVDDRPISSSNVCPVWLNLGKPGTKNDPQFYSQFYSRSENMDHLQYFKDLALENYTNLNNAMAGDLIEDVPVCDYEPYVYKEDDKIRNQVIESYTNLGIQPVLTKIHGGIECAWWYKYNPEINQCSIGPTTPNVHKPQETLYLNSWKKIISVILDTIQAMENI